MNKTEPKERFIPTPIIMPRCTVRRDPETAKIEVGFWYGKPEEGKVQFFTLTSRAAHELEDELVGALSKEGGV